jgi:sugar fermentation stimulation protein A
MSTVYSPFSFPSTLISAKLLRRYKRFLADVEFLDGRKAIAHCPNPGRMDSCMEVGGQVWLSPAQNPRRKLQWSWELSQLEETLVLVNTQRANSVVLGALYGGVLPPFAGYGTIESEVRARAGSRLDFRLQDDDRPTCWIEVKNVTLCMGKGVAAFPDSVSKRGAKHLEVLSGLARSGERAALVYLLGRTDVSTVVPADHIDPVYAEAARRAQRDGVEFYALQTEIDTCKIAVKRIRRLEGW